MDAANLELASGLVSTTYIKQGGQALSQHHRAVKALLSCRRLPERGWEEATIEMFLRDTALMDSNNFMSHVGVGEREARVACPLVARRHFGMAHGIGRSGDVTAEQPKAAGSSLIAKLACLLAADALRLAGLKDLGPVVVLPVATGMALTLTLLALRPKRPDAAKFVIWPRIDQKTCFKSITAACLQPLVVSMRLEGDELRTDLEAIESLIHQHGADAIVCVMTTTSCFAPRGADDVVGVATLCARTGVPHVINNAYGVQSATICAEITTASRKGRVDAIIQSTDKNFMVPVGGALVTGPADLRWGIDLVSALGTSYPGRASASCHVDLLATLLYMGARGWKKILKEREELLPYLQSTLARVGIKLNERVLATPHNHISVAFTLDRLVGTGAVESTSGVRLCNEASTASGDPGPHSQLEAVHMVKPSLPLGDLSADAVDSGEGVGIIPAEVLDSSQVTKSTGLAIHGPEGLGEGILQDIKHLGLQGAPFSTMGSSEETKEQPILSGSDRTHVDSEMSIGEVITGMTEQGYSEDRKYGPLGMSFPQDPVSQGNPAGLAQNLSAKQLFMRTEASEREVMEGGLSQNIEEDALKLSLLQNILPQGLSSDAAAASAVVPPVVEGSAAKQLPPSFLGAMLWQRCVSGVRVIQRGTKQTLGGITFSSYGAHFDKYPHIYLTAAAAVGTTKDDVDEFAARLIKCYNEFVKKAHGGNAPP